MASVLRAHHRGAKFVSSVFKVVAIVILVFGIIGGIAEASSSNNVSTLGTTSSNNGEAAILIFIAAVISSASVLFFAYVLDLLMAIDESTAAAGPTMVMHNAPISPLPLAATATPTPTPIQAATAMPMPAPAPKRAPVYPEAGWFPDPYGITRARFWDGQTWTDKTQA
jgi:hypothetical protein